MRAPDLPTRFPCWCRAVYSWGGETSRDLGFIEGDLIECLNAGDGSWWMGRLRRDKRMMGLFPSNFVVVLDDSFNPASRAASPMPGLQQNGGGSKSRAVSPNPTPSPKKQKSAVRRPFAGYKSAPTRSPSPLPSAASPQPSPNDNEPPYNPANPPSTVLWAQSSHSRHGSRAGSRAASPNPFHDIGSSPPPPPPPPHRVGVSSQRPSRATPSPTPHDMNDRYQTFSRTPSPAPPSLNGHTPPMLRDAMDDVMSSLDGMGMQDDELSHNDRSEPFNPWCPEAFEQLHKPASTRPPVRPLTSLGLGAGGSNRDEFTAYSSNHNSPDRYNDGPPQLSNYVQRMESRLKRMHEQNGNGKTPDELHLPDDNPPAPPPKNSPYYSRPSSSMAPGRPPLRTRKSAYDIGRGVLSRTFTTKSSATNSSSGVQSNATTSTAMTSQSIMSGHSAGGFSATSAGSLARRNKIGSLNRGRPMTAIGNSGTNGHLDIGRGHDLRPQTPLTGVSYHSSHDSRQGAQSAAGWSSNAERAGVLGGLSTPKLKKTGFFKKLIDGAKTGAATARSNIAASQTGSVSTSPVKGMLQNGAIGISSGQSIAGRDAAREMGLGGGNIDWVQVRRDVNRSTSPSYLERAERAERCQMLDHPVISPVEELLESAEGDEGIDGLPVAEPTNWSAINLQLVDKAARFVNSLPPMTTPASLAQGYVCRPYKSDVQRLRAIFTWVSEKIAWDEDFEGDIDSRRVIQSKRGCAHEVAVLVMEMCTSVGLHAEVIQGYLKSPGEDIDLDSLSRPNHWWNAVLVDGEWRMIDASLASQTNPRRSLYSTAASQAAESWYFLTRPLEMCYTHIPIQPEQQHICPPISPDVLLALPCACPPYFKNDLQMLSYDTSLIRLEGLEIANIQITVPTDVECVAEVEVKAFMRDADGDYLENGDMVTKPALAQAQWINGQKRFTVKALLPGDEGQGILKVYAGKRGLMHSSKDNPHPLALALPIVHQGENPPYDFLIRHPTPHAQRHDLYVMQPQCLRLAMNNTFVFAVRQHPSSLFSSSGLGSFDGRVSPSPITRPSSAMSMTSSTTVSVTDANGKTSKDKPAKLAIQSPSGKILRLTRKADHTISTSCGPGEGSYDGSIWETIIKVGERGTWRGLVLADRSARWCVWGEWECV